MFALHDIDGCEQHNKAMSGLNDYQALIFKNFPREHAPDLQ